MPDVVCDVCGGTDFYKDFGHFYCRECQTQTQELQEHVFEEDVVNKKSARKINKAEDKTNDKITSWECYNVILCSLTQQLIQLGAQPRLKSVVKCLWMLYLEKLEVINSDDGVPKLPLINSEKDAEIIFGSSKKKQGRKRRTSQSSASDTTSLNTTVSLKRDRSKKKRLLAEAQLEELTQRSSQMDSASLHTETLQTIKSSSDKSFTGRKYNKYAVKELRRHVTLQHLKKHTANNLNCHKVNYKNRSVKYGVTLITPLKLYCLLYIGLLIVQDKIQLSNLLHFINDGHLSSNYYTDLFPEDYRNKFLNFTSRMRHQPFNYNQFRTATAQLANFLKVKDFIPVPNLVDMCRTYCKELNLPDAISNCAIGLMRETKPKLEFLKSSVRIPNYEARVMTHILVVLKILYSMDDVTEYKYSKYSKICNKHIGGAQMFDFIEWRRHLEYRQLVMEEHHFPSQQSEDLVDSDLFLQYIQTKPKQYDDQCTLTKPLMQYKEFFDKLIQAQDVFETPLEFGASLTRTRECLDVLGKNLQENGYLYDVLRQDFKLDSIDFLIKPASYLELLQIKEKKYKSAASNWIFSQLRTVNADDFMMEKRDKKLVTVQLKKSKKEDFNLLVLEKPEPVPDSVKILNNFLQGREALFLANERKISCKQIDLVHLNPSISIEHDYQTHYYSFNTYWMHFRRYADQGSLEAFQSFFHTYPASFRHVLGEMARILCHNEQQMFIEFQLTEAYLVFKCPYLNPKPRKVQNMKLKNLLKRAVDHW